MKQQVFFDERLQWKRVYARDVLVPHQLFIGMMNLLAVADQIHRSDGPNIQNAEIIREV